MTKRARPRMTIDVAPLMEDHWTGIPVFTRRLIHALMAHGSIDVEFSHQLVNVGAAKVLAAVRSGSGTRMRGDFERLAGDAYERVDRSTHFLFPSVQEDFGHSEHEASTVHDVSTLVMPECHTEANVQHHMKSLALQVASNEVVFCVSEATRAALISAYPSVAAKIRLIDQYVDWPASFEATERNLQPPVIGRYAVVIGTVEPRKNLELLFRALSEPIIKKTDLKFVIVGKPGWKSDELLGELDGPERERIVFTGFVTEFTKYRLLKHSEFLVYPSLYEGFGIPALEAMSLGKPVLASNTSSFPDLIQDSGFYFDPLSLTGFAEAVLAAGDKEMLESRGQRAAKLAASYTQSRMIKPILNWVLEN